jgi:alpha-D-ribose 1-methylphosphonate 5-triphosphate synthase subunit PhnL
MTPPILQVEAYGKHFWLHEQNKLIPSSHNVSFSVSAGSLTALVGPTGVGKSSVLKGIYRTYLPSAGRILYRDAQGHVLDLVRASEHQILELRRREIGFVTQFLHCLPRQSTLDVGLAQIKCDECTHSMRHDHILGDDKRRMECGHKRSMERSQ